jgi:hypothetical protein
MIFQQLDFNLNAWQKMDDSCNLKPILQKNNVSDNNTDKQLGKIHLM